MTKTMKKLTIITALLIASYSVNANAKTYYVGLSSQKNRLNFNESHDNINNIGYNRASREFSGFIGYEFDQSDSSPYQLSIETSYFTDKSNRRSVTNLHVIENEDGEVEYEIITAPGFNSDIRTSILSLNTINNYHINKRISVIGILGLNYANFQFNEYSTVSNYKASDTEDGFGFNYGVGLTFNPLNSDRLSFRAKVVNSVFRNINPSVDSINKINGMTAISIDFKYDF